MVHISYRGGAPAVTDLLGGQVQVIFAPLVEVLQQVRAGKLRALGITTAKRSPLLPDVPTDRRDPARLRGPALERPARAGQNPA